MTRDLAYGMTLLMMLVIVSTAGGILLHSMGLDWSAWVAR
jgi:hypothetical protein